MTQSEIRQSLFSRSTFLYLIGGCSAVLGTFFCWISLFLQPFLSYQKTSQSQLLEIADLNERRSWILDQLTECQSEAVHWRALEEQRMQRCTVQSSDAEFLEWIHQQAELCELTIRDFRPGARLSRNGYEGRSITVSAQGTYESVCRLLDCLRSSPQMFRVTGLDMAARDEEGNGLSLTLQGLLLKSVRCNPTSQNEG